MTDFEVLGIRRFIYKSKDGNITYPACNLYLARPAVPGVNDISAEGYFTQEVFCRQELVSSVKVGDHVNLVYEVNGRYHTLVQVLVVQDVKH